ncbi:hypothetical protein CFIMG_008227RA00001 [Ceratocystis fimbriata CBS 114723]|uniref:Uncharacterized protein n=1 Tax=Ceratocystis fimbriata CBS 114723 TaxID=1035309 RepID=A0A2C5X5D1_9PEZI|nr:hypothetical protein CFIMG_008227RA00001 [Ceratocystis fimbriata CBS 114723]
MSAMNFSSRPLATVPESGAHLEHTAPLNHSRSRATDMSTDSTLHEKGMEVDEMQAIPSPIYDHPVNSFETDVEAMIPNSQTTRGSRKTMNLSTNSDCQVWPGHDHWKRRARAAKKERTCTCLANLSKRNHIIVKVAIGLLIISVAIAVGFGVSKPLGAPIWGDKHDK